jgi:hypothetical protein
MDISATLNGESVTIVAVNGNGGDIYITYIDPSSNLLLTKSGWNLNSGQNFVAIATSASVN